jgi:hypothetical protein
MYAEDNFAPVEQENNISQLIGSILKDENIPEKIKKKLTIGTSPLMALSFLEKDEAKTVMSMLNDALDDSLIYDESLSWDDVAFVPQTRALLYAILKRSVGTTADVKNDNILIRTSIVENISNTKGGNNNNGFFSKLLGRGKRNEDNL